MNIPQLNNIEKYAKYLVEQIHIDYTENTDEQYDANITFFANQMDQIHNVLFDTLEEYSVDWKDLLEENIYYIKEHTILIKAVRACLNGELGIRRLSVKNEQKYKSMLKILKEIQKEIPITISKEDNKIYVHGNKKYLNLIKRMKNENPICKKCNMKYIAWCQDLYMEDCEDYVPITSGCSDDCQTALDIGCPNQMLEVDVTDKISAEDYIRKCFKQE